MNEWRYTSPPIRLHGVGGGISPFSAVVVFTLQNGCHDTRISAEQCIGNDVRKLCNKGNGHRGNLVNNIRGVGGRGVGSSESISSISINPLAPELFF